MELVFFGSGPVAAESLRLLSKNFKIEAVVTKPKPAHHRGETPVLELAEELGLRVLTASNKQELSELFASKPVSSKIAVLIDFGIIVSQDIIDYFPLGIINSHFSILPELRGADPITFALLSGQKTTGVSLMLLVQAMDEGPLIAYDEYNIKSADTSATLTEQLIALSDSLLQKNIPKYIDDQKLLAQETTGRKVSYSRKLTKEDGVLDWTKPAVNLEREIRAYYEWPRSTTTLNGHTLIIRGAHVVQDSGEPGSSEQTKSSLIVHCGKDSLSIDSVQPAGKKEMPIQAFLAGYKL